MPVIPLPVYLRHSNVEMASYGGGDQTLLPSTVQHHGTSHQEDRCILPLIHGIPIIIINSTLVFVGTFGNFLIIFAVLNTHRLRRKLSNFLLLSLAAADLFVTMCAQPLQAISVSFTTFGHYCIPEVDFAYDIAGNFSVFCSLFHLVAISVDRALVVTKPHQHRDIMKRYGLKVMLCVCWGAATVFACLRVPFPATLMLSIALIVLCYIIIMLCYAVILYQITREKVNSNDPAAAMSSSSRDARMEKRVASTIAIIIFFFSLCWFPLLGFYSSVRNAVLRELGGVTYMWIRTAVLSNSSMNFIVYSCRIDHFRIAYLRTINKMLHKPRELFRINKLNASGLSHGSKDNDMVMELRGDLVGSQNERYSRGIRTGITSCTSRTKESGKVPRSTRQQNKRKNIQKTPTSSNKELDSEEKVARFDPEEIVSYSNIISNPVILQENTTVI